MRKLISDFAIILTIFLFCGVDALVGVETPKLIVPSEFKVHGFIYGEKYNFAMNKSDFSLELESSDDTDNDPCFGWKASVIL